MTLVLGQRQTGEGAESRRRLYMKVKMNHAVVTSCSFTF